MRFFSKEDWQKINKAKLVYIFFNVVLLLGLFVWKNGSDIGAISDYTVELIFDGEEVNENDRLIVNYLKDDVLISESQVQLQSPSFTISKEFLEAQGTTIDLVAEEGTLETLSLQKVGVYYKDYLLGYVYADALDAKIGESATINFDESFNSQVRQMVLDKKVPYLYFGIQLLLLLLVLLVVFAICIQLCRKVDKRIVAIVLFALNLIGWLLKAYANQYVLLFLGIAWLYVLTDWLSTDEKVWGKCKVLLGVCIFAIIGYLNPSEYTGELVHNGKDLLDEVWVVYQSKDVYAWCNELESKGKLVELPDEFFVTDEVVISFFLTDVQEANQYEIDAFKVYSNGFWIGSISGNEMMLTCQNVENLSYEEPKENELSIRCTDWYARMYLKQAFAERVDGYKNADFSNELYAIYFVSVFLLISHLLTLFINLLKLCNEENKWKRIGINSGVLLCAALGQELFIETVSGSIDDISPLAFGLNIILFLGINLLLYAITNLKVSICITTLLSAIIGIANYYTLSYRGTPILPWDIYSINTALDVAGNYNIYISQKMLCLLLIVVIPAMFAIKVANNTKLHDAKRWLEKGISLLVAILFIGISTNDSFVKSLGIVENEFEQVSNYAVNGWGLATALNLKYLKIDKPDEFSEDKIQEILSEYEVEEDSIEQEDLPNIIIILNESFADMQSVYQMETNQEVMPFINSLSGENVAKGMCTVSQIGGGTCNSEYEFLMGSTMAFLPSGSITFQQYIMDEQYSLINILNNAGYNSMGMHPMTGSNWNRTKAYPLLQFNDSFFSEELEGIEYIRGYASDAYCYQWVIDQFEEKEEDERLALYIMTVQNHGGYEDTSYTGDISVNGSQNSVAWDQYLSLINESDRALEGLLSYFEESDEEVVVLFMGDHQPSLQPEEWMEYEMNFQDKFEVPYVLWNNYGQKMDVPEKISINYMASYLLKNCGIQQSSYYNFLESMSQEIPVINADLYIDSNGQVHYWQDQEYNQWIEEYRILQYGLNSDEVIHKQDYYE